MSMPFALLALGAVLALIALSAVLGSVRSPGLDGDAFRRLLSREEPGFRAAEILISENGKGAAAWDGVRRLGLAKSMGSHWVVRILDASDVLTCRVHSGKRGPARLTVTTRDFAFGGVTLYIKDQAKAAFWRQIIETDRERGSA